MPSGKLANLVYRAALPAAGVRSVLTHETVGLPPAFPGRYRRILARHHVSGASLLLRDGDKQLEVFSSVTGPRAKDVTRSTLFRVASLTKMVTVAAVLRLCDRGLLRLDDALADVLPGAGGTPAGSITLRQLLSHTSGLRDTPAADAALAHGDSWRKVLDAPGTVGAAPGETFAYCNFGFGLAGCVLEQATGLPVSGVLSREVLQPLGMRGSLDASTLDPGGILPITRVLSRHRMPDVQVTPLGRIPLAAADPERHFGHTAGALYTDAPSLSRLLGMIAAGGVHEGEPYISPAMAAEMTRVHAVYGRLSPTLAYGLGLLIIRDARLSEHRILGHQGFAYGCADGAFYEEGTGRQVIFLNGGCSEARDGRLGVCNRDILRFALREEMAAWK